ncbi:MAG: xanthine dehydrogenase family protein molybdopterin-binding subunit [Spirochaetales bacterium]|nr:xanthine dehydrogenase family protein molybdopterin-binding subunit [Spirochaetales bacterium]
MKSKNISETIPRPDGMAKATGRALYIADLPQGDADGRTQDGGVPVGPSVGLGTNQLVGRFYRSPHPRGRITARRYPQVPDGYTIVDATHVPGKNQIPMAASRDLPCFADEEVRYIGQIVAIVVGPDPQVVDELVDGIEIDVEARPVCLNMEESIALKGGAIHGTDNVFCRVDLDRGDVDAAFAHAATVAEGVYDTGFQEQFYMEGQGLITWRDGDRVGVRGSMQCPYYVNHAVTHVLGLPHDGVRVIQDTVGGAFGGKEDYPEIMGAPMAVASWVTGQPVKMLMDRVEDMAFTSKRHPSRCTYRSAWDAQGHLLAMDVLIDIDGGAYESYTKIVLMRAVFTCLGVYNVPAFRIRGRGLATNTVPSGAFRGFGAPQSLFGLEMHMEEAARTLGVESLELKKKLFLQKGDSTITEGTFRDTIILDELVAEAERLSQYSQKRAQYPTGGMRGIGMSFIIHGCGFTGDGEQKIIKGEVALEKDEAGHVEILCAAVDFGQGPQTTFRKVVAAVLGKEPEEIGFRYPDTDRVPDSGPTVASRTMMVVGYLIQKAAEDLRDHWKEGEFQRVEQKYSMPPGMAWDQEKLLGDCYATYGWGINVCEVETDPVTWETKVVGAWGIYDVGKAVDQRVVDGQIQGGMSQSLGYGAMEKLEIDHSGRFRQITMSDYMVPTSLDFPRTEASTVDNPYPYGPFGAKGMGEMVHDAGHAAYAAAVEQAVGKPCPCIPLVPETLLNIMEEHR